MEHIKWKEKIIIYGVNNTASQTASPMIWISSGMKILVDVLTWSGSHCLHSYPELSLNILKGFVGGSQNLVWKTVQD